MSHRVGSPSNPDDHQPISPKSIHTAGTKFKESTAAKVKGDLKKVWIKCMEAEERERLHNALIKEGIGTNDVENYERKRSDKFMGKGKGKRNEVKIVQEIGDRLKDCEEDSKKWRKRRGILRSKLEKMLGSKSKEYKMFINKVKETIKFLKTKQQKKREEKVRRVKSNIKKSTFKLQHNLSRYSSAKIFTSDSELPPEELRGPVLVGDEEITLSFGEKAVLTRGPKFTVRRILSLENFLNELTKCHVKERWEATQREEEGGPEEVMVEMNEEERRRIEEISKKEEAKCRQIYDQEEGRVDFGNLKVTDTKGNTRVFLPKPKSVEFEMELQMKRIEWTKVFNDYVSELCDEQGVQESNLSKEEEEGLKSLKKRVADGDIVVCQTDKSGRFAIMTMADYRYAGSKHVQHDKEVDLEYVRKNQRRLNSHCSMLMKILLVGKN